MSKTILAVAKTKRKIFVSESGLEWIAVGLHN